MKPTLQPSAAHSAVLPAGTEQSPEPKRFVRKPLFQKENFPEHMLAYHMRFGILYKLSEADENQFTAVQMWPAPERTTVHAFGWDEAVKFSAPPSRVVQRYEDYYDIR